MSGRIDPMQTETSGGNTVKYPVRIRTSTTQTPAAGLGTGLEFYIKETNGSEISVGTIEMVYTSAASGSAKSKCVIKTLDQGDDGVAARVEIDPDGNLTVNGTTTLTGVLTASASATPAGGLAPAGGTTIVLARPGCVHTGGIPVSITGSGIDATPVVTEIYYSELFIPCNMSVTGISVFNGSVASDDWHRALLDADGALVSGSATGAVTSSGTDAYQKVPFSGGAITLLGPATYYVAQICDGTTDRYNAHGTATTGMCLPTNMVAGKLTGQTYGAIPATNTLTLTYTTDLGPIASLY